MKEKACDIFFETIREKNDKHGWVCTVSRGCFK